MKKQRKRETVILALLLFAISGVSLGYNLITASGGAVSVSLGELLGEGESVISASARAHLEGDSIAVGVAPTLTETEALLPPIVTPGT